MVKVEVVGRLLLLLVGCLTVASPATASLTLSASPSIAVETEPQPIPGWGEKPAVASSGSEWLVVWATREVVGRFVNHDGSPAGMPFNISIGDVDQPFQRIFSLDVVFDGDSFVAVWVEIGDQWHSSSSKVCAQRIDVHGRLLGERQVLYQNHVPAVKVASNGASVLVAACAIEYLDPECSLFLSTGGPFERTDERGFDNLDLEHFAIAASNDAWLFVLDGSFLRVSADGVWVDDAPQALYENGYNSNEYEPTVVDTPSGFAVAWDDEGSIRLAEVPFVGNAALRQAPLLTGSQDWWNRYHHPALYRRRSGYALIASGCGGPCVDNTSGSTLLELDDELQPDSAPTPTVFSTSWAVPEQPFDELWSLAAYAPPEAGKVTVQLLTTSPIDTVGSAVDVSLTAPWQSGIHAARLGEGWLVVWEEQETLRGAVLDAGGVRNHSPFVIQKPFRYAFEEFRAISGGASGALVAFQEQYKTIVVHVNASGIIDNKTVLPRIGAAALRLAPSSAGWLALYNPFDDSDSTLVVQRLALDGSPLDSAKLTDHAEWYYGMDVVTTHDGYKVFWREQDAIWSRRLLLDGTWLCELPTHVASVEPRSNGLSVVVAGEASWFTWRNADYGDYGTILSLPSGLTRQSVAVSALGINSAALAVRIEPNTPRQTVTYTFSEIESDLSLTAPLLAQETSGAELALAGGSAMLFASTEMVRLYGAEVRRAATTIVTASGGGADIVPSSIPDEACPLPPTSGGDGGAPGMGGMLNEAGGGPGGDGGAAADPIDVAGAGGASSADQGGDSSLGAGRDSGGAASDVAGGVGGQFLGDEGGNAPNTGGQATGGSNDNSSAGGGAAGDADDFSGRNPHHSRGCGCRAAGEPSTTAGWGVFALLVLARFRRRQRRHELRSAKCST